VIRIELFRIRGVKQDHERNEYCSNEIQAFQCGMGEATAFAEKFLACRKGIYFCTRGSATVEPRLLEATRSLELDYLHLRNHNNLWDLRLGRRVGEKTE